MYPDSFRFFLTWNDRPSALVFARAKLAYAWSHKAGKGDSDERFVAVLEIPPSCHQRQWLRFQSPGLRTAKEPQLGVEPLTFNPNRTRDYLYFVGFSSNSGQDGFPI